MANNTYVSGLKFISRGSIQAKIPKIMKVSKVIDQFFTAINQRCGNDILLIYPVSQAMAK